MDIYIFFTVFLLALGAISYYIILPRITELNGVFRWNLLGTLPIVVLNLCSFFLPIFSHTLFLVVNVTSSFVLLFIVMVNLAYFIFSVRQQATAYVTGCLFLFVGTMLYWVMQALILFWLYLIIFSGSPGR